MVTLVVLAVVVMAPDKLPRMGAKAAKTLREFRRSATRPAKSYSTPLGRVRER
ncbi:twin-arginine translocase TatA/TatE family subunit [Yinghuangia aomiensis]